MGKRRRCNSFRALYNLYHDKTTSSSSSSPSESDYRTKFIALGADKASKKDLSFTRKFTLKRTGTFATAVNRKRSMSNKFLLRSKTFVKPVISKTPMPTIKSPNGKNFKDLFITSNKKSKKKLGRLMQKKANKADNKLIMDKVNDLIQSASEINSGIVKNFVTKNHVQKKIEEKERRQKLILKRSKKKAVTIMQNYLEDYQKKLEEFKIRTQRRRQNLKEMGLLDRKSIKTFSSSSKSHRSMMSSSKYHSRKSTSRF